MGFNEKRNYDFFLEVPFSEKDEAKKAGAWWSPERRKWFVPARRSVVPFVRWFPPDEKAAYEHEMRQREEQRRYYARLAELEKLEPRWTDPGEILRQLGRTPVYRKHAFCIGCDSHIGGWYIGDMELRHSANTDYGTFHRSELGILEAALDAGLLEGRGLDRVDKAQRIGQQAAMAFESDFINASELGEFVYCARAWHLTRHGATSSLVAERKRGVEFHQRDSEAVHTRRSRTSTVAVGFAVIALLLLALWLVWALR